MKIIYRNEDRGKNQIEWLDSKFSFSFADYYDPNKMGFGKLIVLNDDIISPGKGFGAHPHSNMEIITIVLEGELKHKDSLGSEDIIRPGEVQVMSAGSGIVHSEYNNSKTKALKLFQIWIETKKEDLNPTYNKKKYELVKNRLIVLASGFDEGLKINQDAKVSLGKFDKELDYNISEENGVYFFVIEGSFKVNNEEIGRRDALGTDEDLKISGKGKFLIIDVPL